MPTNEFIVEVWESMGKDVVSASELAVIQQAISERFGVTPTPATIARVLADHGARLGHPQILQTDAHWREKQLLFTAEDLELNNIEAAVKLVNKVEQLRQQSENVEGLRQAVRSLKSELESFAKSNPLAAGRAMAGSLAAKPADLRRMAHFAAEYTRISRALSILNPSPRFWNFPTFRNEYQ